MEIAIELEELKKEIQSLRGLILFGKDELLEKRLVSLRGMGRLLVSEDELEEAIKRAKKSVFAGMDDIHH